MSHLNNNSPNLKNSKTVGQEELQNVKENLNTTSGQGMISGSVPNLNSSTSVESEELQSAKNKVQQSGNNKGLF